MRNLMHMTWAEDEVFTSYIYVAVAVVRAVL